METSVEIGSVWVSRSNKKVVKRVTDEKCEGGIRMVLLVPVEGSSGRPSWKYDRHVPHDMERLERSV